MRKDEQRAQFVWQAMRAMHIALGVEPPTEWAGLEEAVRCSVTHLVAEQCSIARLEAPEDLYDQWRRRQGLKEINPDAVDHHLMNALWRLCDLAWHYIPDS